MKFVGHCSSVLKCFKSDFMSIVSTLSKLDSEEGLGLQEKILRLDFILDYLFMSDIMFHLTICSKQVQSSFSLPWEFTKAIDSLIKTLNSCLDSLTTCNVQSPSCLDSKLYPGFCHAYDIITKKEYQGCPLMDLPISSTRTRSKNIDFESDDFLRNTVQVYTAYIRALKKNIELRFISNNNSSYTISKSLGELLDFSWLLYPSTNRHYSELRDVSIDTFKQFLNPFHFVSTKDDDIKQLLFEYIELCKYAFKAACDHRVNYSLLTFNHHVLKQFVSMNSEKCPLIYRFLSNVVAMQSSEAIVESWGSCIDHLHKNKPHTMEVTGGQDLTSDTGTVDKFAFIKLNGPPPGAA